MIDPYFLSLPEGERPRVYRFEQTGLTLTSCVNTLAERGYITFATRWSGYIETVNVAPDLPPPAAAAAAGAPVVAAAPAPAPPPPLRAPEVPAPPRQQKREYPSPSGSMYEEGLLNPAAIKRAMMQCDGKTVAAALDAAAVAAAAAAMPTGYCDSQPDDEDALNVRCPYPSCSFVKRKVPLEEFALHVIEKHRTEEQSGLLCPLCPIVSDIPDFEPQENLMMHLHDVHASHMKEDVHRKLSEAIDSQFTAQFEMESALIASEQAQAQREGQAPPPAPIPGQVVPVVVNTVGAGGPGPATPAAKSPPPLAYASSTLSADDSKSGECPICFEPFLKGQEVARLPCLCVFHRSCIEAWFTKSEKRACPTHANRDDH